jgi:hypothetical protein
MGFHTGGMGSCAVDGLSAAAQKAEVVEKEDV